MFHCDAQTGSLGPALKTHTGFGDVAGRVCRLNLSQKVNFVFQRRPHAPTSLCLSDQWGRQFSELVHYIW